MISYDVSLPSMIHHASFQLGRWLDRCFSWAIIRTRKLWFCGFPATCSRAPARYGPSCNVGPKQHDPDMPFELTCIFSCFMNRWTSKSNWYFQRLQVDDNLIARYSPLFCGHVCPRLSDQSEIMPGSLASPPSAGAVLRTYEACLFSRQKWGLCCCALTHLLHWTCWTSNWQFVSHFQLGLLSRKLPFLPDLDGSHHHRTTTRTSVHGTPWGLKQQSWCTGAHWLCSLCTCNHPPGQISSTDIYSPWQLQWLPTLLQHLYTERG